MRLGHLEIEAQRRRVRLAFVAEAPVRFFVSVAVALQVKYSA